MSEIHLDTQMCRQCGGLCCRAHPGVWCDPLRFAAIYFAKRRFSLAELERSLEKLGLQLRDYSGVPVPAPKETETGCSLQQQDGCQLTPEQRPCQCLALEPDIETLITGEIHCTLPGGYSYGEVRRRWQEYWAA